MFSLLNDCHMLVESTTSIICSLDAGLEKKRLSCSPRHFASFLIPVQVTFKGPGQSISNKTINNHE